MERCWLPVCAYSMNVPDLEKMVYYELPYMVSAMCDCLLVSDRVLVTPGVV